MTSPLTLRCMSVTSSGRSSISSTISLTFGIVGRDRLADVLQQDRLAGARRSDDQGPLALAQRREQVHHARGERLRAGFQLQPCFGVDRRQLRRSVLTLT